MTKDLIEIVEDCPLMDVIKTATLNYNHVLCNSEYDDCPYQSNGTIANEQNKLPNYCWKHLMLSNYEKGDEI